MWTFRLALYVQFVMCLFGESVIDNKKKSKMDIDFLKEVSPKEKKGILRILNDQNIFQSN